MTGFTSPLTSFPQTILCSTEKKPTTIQTIAHLTKTEYWNSWVRKAPERSMGSEGNICCCRRLAWAARAERCVRMVYKTVVDWNRKKLARGWGTNFSPSGLPVWISRSLLVCWVLLFFFYLL